MGNGFVLVFMFFYDDCCVLARKGRCSVLFVLACELFLFIRLLIRHLFLACLSLDRTAKFAAGEAHKLSA